MNPRSERILLLAFDVLPVFVGVGVGVRIMGFGK
jgi:hypothetical protein